MILLFAEDRIANVLLRGRKLDECTGVFLQRLYVSVLRGLKTVKLQKMKIRDDLGKRHAFKLERRTISSSSGLYSHSNGYKDIMWINSSII